MGFLARLTSHLFGEARIHQTSRLFSLPAELRLSIYAHVFSYEEEQLFSDIRQIVSASHGDVTKSAFMPRKHWIALLYTCRQIYAEAIPLVYRHTHFLFMEGFPDGRLKTMERFLNSVGSVNASCITTIHTKFPPLLADYRKKPFGSQVLREPRRVMILPSSLDHLMFIRNAFPGLTTLVLWTEFRCNAYSLPADINSVGEALIDLAERLRIFVSQPAIHVHWGAVRDR
jgi:hypothetical protein